jgi:hypothetical protein
MIASHPTTSNDGQKDGAVGTRNLKVGLRPNDRSLSLLSTSPTTVSSLFVPRSSNTADTNNDLSSLPPSGRGDHPGRDGTSDDWTVLPASAKSQRTRNPIRAIVDTMMDAAHQSSRPNSDEKEHISLAVRKQHYAGSFSDR